MLPRRLSPLRPLEPTELSYLLERQIRRAKPETSTTAAASQCAATPYPFDDMDLTRYPFG